MTESTANYIQVAVAGLTFLVFVGLALITLHYAWQTKRMADIMSKEFEFRYRPFVDLRVGLPFLLDDNSGFRIPLEALLLGELPFTVTKVELEIELGSKETRQILKLPVLIDKTLTKSAPLLRSCTGPFAHERILDYMQKRMEDANMREPQLSSLHIYHKNIELKEELFQRLPVPYRNYYELDDTCGRDPDIISTFGQTASGDVDVEEF
ncbi:MAG: hypothetical protein WBF13_03000 [Candidatus Zixiibacteriota bacterium]